MSFTTGDVSGSGTLTDSDHLYPVLFNELRESLDGTRTVTINQSTTTGSAITISRNLASSATDSPIITLSQLNANDDQDILKLTNEANSNALFIDKNGKGLAIKIDNHCVTNADYENFCEIDTDGTKRFLWHTKHDSPDYNILEFFPEGNATADVDFTVHKTWAVSVGGDGTTVHRHFSAYTTNAAGTLTKRFDLPYLSDVSDALWVHTDTEIRNLDDTGATARKMLYLYNAASGASGTIPLFIRTDATSRSINVWQLGESGDTASVFLNIDSNSRALDIDTDATSKMAINVYTNAIRTHPLIYFNVANESSTGNVLSIANTGSGEDIVAPNFTLKNGYATFTADSINIAMSQSPASNGTGVAGEIAWDASYIYVCTATNTWERAALTGGY